MHHGYHGSYLDLPHAGLLTPLLLMWVVWAAIGWRWPRSPWPIVAVMLCAVGGFVTGGPFAALVTGQWMIFLAAGRLARGLQRQME